MTLHLDKPDAWMRHAVCAGTDTEQFFPHRGDSTVKAKAMCYVCPVRAECLTYAMENGEKYGIWGGFSERERSRLRRQYKRARGET